MEKDIFDEDNHVDVMTIDEEKIININRSEIENQIQMDVLNKKVTKSTIFNSKVSFLFNSRSSDDFIGLFNFIFDFSDGSTYNYKFGKLTIGNDMKLSSITRGIYVH